MSLLIRELLDITKSMKDPSEPGVEDHEFKVIFGDRKCEANLNSCLDLPGMINLEA